MILDARPLEASPSRYRGRMAVAVAAMPLEGLVDLINEWGSVPRRDADEQSSPYPPRGFLRGRLGVAPSLIPKNDEALAAIADRLHPVFAATRHARRAELVNDLLAATAVRPALHTKADGLHVSWLVDDPGQAVLAAAAIALRAQLASHDPDRLGTCTGSRCADVYIDASPAGRRRYCSTTCQTRTRVAAYRSRNSGS